jgi:hypothetical protein
MQIVKVRFSAADLSREMAAMREWLDSNRYEPTKFRYDQDDEAVTVSVEFSNAEEAEAFAGRFDVARRLNRHRPVWEVRVVPGQ